MRPATIGRHFSPTEMIRTNQPLDNEPDIGEWVALAILVALVLDPLREGIGPVSVNSGFRSEAVNRAVGGSETSDHMHGFAADIVAGPKPSEWSPGWGPERLAQAIVDRDLPYDQIIVEPGWVHVSYRPDGKNRGQLLRKTSAGYAPWVPKETP